MIRRRNDRRLSFPHTSKACDYAGILPILRLVREIPAKMQFFPLKKPDSKENREKACIFAGISSKRTGSRVKACIFAVLEPGHRMGAYGPRTLLCACGEFAYVLTFRSTKKGADIGTLSQYDQISIHQ
ncbi:hypothetical protein [Paenibacillus aceti]|uniref:hypothetical protein n=1 Tax=Paenibacillus aceti TaxID=1820010 RepID=UPI000EA13E47|nr:hypothetical protein [Paenibacillus aceti]